MENLTFQRSVRQTLTIEDKLRIGSELAEAVAKQVAAEEELKAIKADYNNRIARSGATANTCQIALNNGWQMVDVDCSWVMDFPLMGQKSIVRTDTNEIVETEKMTDRDRQKVLDFQGSGANAN